MKAGASWLALGESDQGEQSISDARRIWYFVLGWGLGLIPLIQAIFGSSFFSVGSIFWSIDVVASYVLFGVVAVATLVCLIVKPVRIIGWGLLFAVLMTLCFGAVAYSYVVEHL